MHAHQVELILQELEIDIKAEEDVSSTMITVKLMHKDETITECSCHINTPVKPEEAW